MRCRAQSHHHKDDHRRCRYPEFFGHNDFLSILVNETSPVRMLRSKVPAKHSATDRPNPSKSDSFQFGEVCSKESGKATPEDTAIPLEK
jgi:hypothetical protein